MAEIDVQKIEPILKESGIAYAGIFGSYARGEATPESDVDILVKLGKRMGLFAFAGLQRKLSEALGKKVDLVTERALSPYIKDRVLSDLKIFYGSRT